MLLKRVLTAVVGMPVIIAVFYLGGVPMLCGVLLVVLVGIAEINNLSEKASLNSLTLPLWLGAIIFPYIFQYNSSTLAMAISLFLFVTLIYYLWQYPRYSPADLAFSLFGFFYVVLGFCHLVLLRQLAGGFWLVLYVFIIVWSTDTAAYFTGTYFGRRLLAPHISPKKTWVGFIGGLIFSTVAAYILLTAAGMTDRMYLFWFAPVVSLAGQLGDLFESTLKRYAKIKDSGYIIPGHGGMLDRFDSTLWAAPLTYLLVGMERLF